MFDIVLNIFPYAIAFTIGKFGLDSLKQLAALM